MVMTKEEAAAWAKSSCNMCNGKGWVGYNGVDNLICACVLKNRKKYKEKILHEQNGDKVVFDDSYL